MSCINKKGVIFKKLSQEGFRMTKARVAIAKYFDESRAPSNALKIYRELKKSGLKTDKSTVYREIKFLQNLGLICEVFTDPKSIMYESSSLKHHHHLICKGCGDMQDFYLSNHLKETEKNILSKTNFRVQNHSLEFFGLCINCQ
jgi:Fe2+ or Zn2+ uptake regulation protein